MRNQYYDLDFLSLKCFFGGGKLKWKSFQRCSKQNRNFSNLTVDVTPRFRVTQQYKLTDHCNARLAKSRVFFFFFNFLPFDYCLWSQNFGYVLAGRASFHNLMFLRLKLWMIDTMMWSQKVTYYSTGIKGVITWWISARYTGHLVTLLLHGFFLDSNGQDFVK